MIAAAQHEASRLCCATDRGYSGDENRKRKVQASCVYSGKHYPTTALIERDRW